jgi:hypothetical protein
VLEVVAAEMRCLPVHWAQHVKPPEQAHQWLHPHKHLAEVGEDHHQRDGVWRQVLKLKTIVLQQHNEEGGERRHEPDQGVRREVDEVAKLGERQHPASHL